MRRWTTAYVPEPERREFASAFEDVLIELSRLERVADVRLQEAKDEAKNIEGTKTKRRTELDGYKRIVTIAQKWASETMREAWALADAVTTATALPQPPGAIPMPTADQLAILRRAQLVLRDGPSTLRDWRDKAVGVRQRIDRKPLADWHERIGRAPRAAPSETGRPKGRKSWYSEPVRWLVEAAMRNVRPDAPLSHKYQQVVVFAEDQDKLLAKHEPTMAALKGVRFKVRGGTVEVISANGDRRRITERMVRGIAEKMKKRKKTSNPTK